MSLRITTSAGGCCAISALQDLQTTLGPEDAMKQFCVKELSTSRYAPRPRQLACFYLFSAGKQTRNPYGKRFAAFIRKHKLGRVYAAGEQWNYRYHPDHKSQAWLWRPDTDAVRAWWAEHGGPPLVS